MDGNAKCRQSVDEACRTTIALVMPSVRTACSHASGEKPGR